MAVSSWDSSSSRPTGCLLMKPSMNVESLYVVVANVHGPLEHADRRTGEPQMLAGPGPAHGHAATRRIDLHFFLQQPEPAPDRHRAASSGTARPRLAGAALVDAQPDVLRADHFHEAYVGAAWKAGMIFHSGAESVHGRGAHRSHLDDRVWVTHRNRADLQLLLADAQRVDVSLARRLERQRRGIEVRHAHVERHVAVVVQFAVDAAAGTAEPHRAASEPTRDQAGDAAGAVGALFDLGAVGIEDAVEDVGARGTRRRQCQRLVEADAGVAVRETAQG